MAELRIGQRLEFTEEGQRAVRSFLTAEYALPIIGTYRGESGEQRCILVQAAGDTKPHCWYRGWWRELPTAGGAR